VTENTPNVIHRGVVPWTQLKLDVFLLLLSLIVVAASLLYDITQKQHDYFQRSGAVMVLLAGILAYRGLSKYWIKAENSFNRGYWLRTSVHQTIVDLSTLAISVLGTAIWGYGDKAFAYIFQ
jgi:hypothetical protein